MKDEKKARGLAVRCQENEAEALTQCLEKLGYSWMLPQNWGFLVHCADESDAGELAKKLFQRGWCTVMTCPWEEDEDNQTPEKEDKQEQQEEDLPEAAKPVYRITTEIDGKPNKARTRTNRMHSGPRR
ncbi:MAG: hypothetical protein LUH14_04070 [Clostridiaceae bacterium]|nr:hypothetical protein [Clostridiaceae bacterium]